MAIGALIGALLAMPLSALASAAARAAATHVLVSQFGSFVNPQGIAVDQATGDVYVIDVGAGTVSRFDASGAPADFPALGTNVLGGFGFDSPDAAQVAIDDSGGVTSGDVYVADFGSGGGTSGVDVFAADGTHLGRLTGTPAGPYGEACGVAVDATGALYVGDFSGGGGSGAVHKYVPSANPPLESDAVLDVASPNPCELGVDAAGSLFVNGWVNADGNVRKYDALGTLLYPVTGPLTGAPPVAAMALDPASSRVFAVQGTHVAEYDASGALAAAQVDSFGAGQLGSPAGVGVNGATGNVYVADGATGAVDVFAPAILPDVATGPATGVSDTGARVSGTVNPDGVPATWQFEYGTDASYGSVAPAAPAGAGAGTAPVAVGATLTGLQPNTTYHFRLDASNASGMVHGADGTFTTQGPPAVQAETLFALGDTSATVSAQLLTGLSATTYHVEWGTDASYGHDAPVPDAGLGAAAGPQTADVRLTGLAPQTTYHWRFVARNAHGTVAGPDRSFTTDASPLEDGIARPPGGVDGRGWELVSAPDLNGNQVNVAVPAQEGADGTVTAALYSLLSGGAPDSSAGVGVFSAHRTASGWVSANALPPRAQMPFSQYFIGATTPDVSQWIAGAKDGLGGNDDSPGAALARLDDAGAQQLLQRFSLDFDPSGISVVASDDLRHVLVLSPQALDPSQAAGTSDVYDVGGGAPVLVSAMPGTGRAPSCGLALGGDDFPAEPGGDAASQHWVSSDGSRAFFTTQGDDCFGPRQLYVRDLAHATTMRVSAAPVAGDPDLGVDGFVQATPDGSAVFFRTRTSYSPADDADGHADDMDVYRWTASDGRLACVTCGVPNADVLRSVRSGVVVSQDGSHAYFLSAAQAAGAPSAGSEAEPNLYVWRAADGSTRFVAQIGGGTIADRPADGGQTTPDGSVLLFRSNAASLDALTGAANGGFMQFYRYDDRPAAAAHPLSCLSCPPAGAATRDVPADLVQPLPYVSARVRAMTDDGSIAIFPTWDALVPQDVNRDLDVYEWHDGVVKLITSGAGRYPGTAIKPTPVSVSANGRDVFFLDSALLTWQARDSAWKLYDARAGGGFPAPSQPVPCAGDGCKGTAPAAPALLAPGSGAAGGSGNLAAPAPPRVLLRVGAVSAAERRSFARSGRLVLRVRVGGAGVVSVLGRARIGRRTLPVARGAARARRAGLLHVTVRLSGTARGALARGHAVRVTLTVRFAGATRSVRLLLTPPRGAGHGR